MKEQYKTKVMKLLGIWLILLGILAMPIGNTHDWSWKNWIFWEGFITGIFVVVGYHLGISVSEWLRTWKGQ